jgi:hypothetical protein
LSQNYGELSSPALAFCALFQNQLDRIWSHPVGTAVCPPTPILWYDARFISESVSAQPPITGRSTRYFQ